MLTKLINMNLLRASDLVSFTLKDQKPFSIRETTKLYWTGPVIATI